MAFQKIWFRWNVWEWVKIQLDQKDEDKNQWENIHRMNTSLQPIMKENSGRSNHWYCLWELVIRAIRTFANGTFGKLLHPCPLPSSHLPPNQCNDHHWAFIATHFIQEQGSSIFYQEDLFNLHPCNCWMDKLAFHHDVHGDNCSW